MPQWDCCLAFLLRKHSQDNESWPFDSALASSLLALRLFELPRSRRVTNQPAKRAVYVFACRDQFTPFVADCSLNTRCRSNLVLCLRPARPAFNDGSRRNFTLSTVHCGRWISQIKVEIRCLSQTCCDKRRSEQRTRNSIFSQFAVLLSQLSHLLSYVALLAQSQNESNESNPSLLDASKQATSRLQQPTLELNAGRAHQ